jgi:TorA maturation chaperone TorD
MLTGTLARDRLRVILSAGVPMKACLTVLAAVAWLVSAALWWWASRNPPALPDLTADADRGWSEPFNKALRGAAQRNKYAAVAAMVAAALQAAAIFAR